MSVFEGIDATEFENASPKPCTYPARVKVLDMDLKSKAGDRYAVFEYIVDDPSYEFPIQDWFRMPETPANTWDRTTVIQNGRTEYDLNVRSLKFFRQRLLNLGVPEDRLNAVTDNPSLLENMPFIITTKPQPGTDFMQVSRVAPRVSAANKPAPAETTTPAPAAAPAAPATGNPFAGL